LSGDWHRARSRDYRGPRGLRPLTVVALCSVVAVLAVVATTATLPYANSGGTSVAAADGYHPSADPASGVPTRSAVLGSALQGGSTPSPAPASARSTPRRSAASSTRPAAPAPPPPPPPPVVVPPADGPTVWVVNRASNQHFGVAQDSTSDGALIVQSTSAGTAQQWRLIAASGGCYQLMNVHSGKALDNPGSSGTDGTQMQQWSIGAGNANQTWCFQSVGAGRYSIRNSASGSLLDLRDGMSGDGVAIQEWRADPAAPNANQTWQLIRAG
jgi:hypothetical protein